MVRWAPAHLGVEGNERVEALAKRAAEGEEGRAEPGYLGEASLSYLTRKTRRPDPAPRGSGFEAMSRRSADPTPRLVEGSARGWARFERS